MIEFLQSRWDKLTCDLPDVKTDFYNQIIELYSNSKRHYHNLNHITALLRLVQQYRYLLKSPQTIEFAVWYHDVIYNVSKSNNEESSAEMARNHLTQLGVEESVISECQEIIIATKSHRLPKGLDSFDAKFFLDIDLSILAADQEGYLTYTKQIRKEYGLYPDFLYNRGRKKLLLEFLNVDRIYQTNLFFENWEIQARDNIEMEIGGL
ncbi:HD domain-containing protein [Reichenbachiella versicolor]|uniref:HD domain-containing protein n=1 Tax=Reichenbachiella versicolor TaxID=1821036 RepID=UPI000D6EA423|nr:hypothetical protein [Reichenbachiella versicolor]